ncbi:hypothetical protein [Achromobacter marplatensis]|uniref:hypothetical protein n=1 Tax=Achromobacter marplatensis TaxID=470868 RepID=UPI0028EB1B18|nr:hypothetical protein [Achromobacter marplatensis]
MQLYLETTHPECAEHARTALNSTDLAVTLTAVDADVIYFDGIHEAVYLYLENYNWAAAIGAATGVVGAEMVKDVYRKVKHLALYLFKRFEPNNKQIGIELSISPIGRRKKGFVDTPDEIVVFTYSGREGSRGRYHFDEAEVQKAFRTYETVVVPVISYWKQYGSVTKVSAYAYIGPGENTPRWELVIFGK